jgi:DMSO/TMAO reductase YedYZ molybdopterin-dependent catalytic subunit
VTVNIVSRGFSGRRREERAQLPPGQYLVEDFPVLSAGPTPRVPLDQWELRVVNETGQQHRWSWSEFRALPTQDVVVDLHCVTRWSKLATPWRGVSLDTLLGDVETAADYVSVSSYGGYTTNVPLEDLLDGKAWVAFQFEGEDVAPEHGGPARLLVPHLYLWKSAKWLRALTLTLEDEPGFWETAGYHNYGDPWREQRYWGE